MRFKNPSRRTGVSPVAFMTKTIRRPLSLRALLSAAISLLFFLLSSLFTTPAFATPTVTAVTSVAISEQGILPNSPRTALLRLEITAANGTEQISGIEAGIENYSETVFNDISRISIYQDNDGLGVFSNADTDEIDYIIPPSDGVFTKMFTVNRAVLWNGTAYKWFYFIVVETSGSISHADAFRGKFIQITYVGGNSYAGATTSNVVRCECKVVDIYYTESYSELLGYPGFPLFIPGLVNYPYETYVQPNYIPYSIFTEMTEPNETNPAGTHRYYLSEAHRYSYLTGAEDFFNSEDRQKIIAASSNYLKFERRRKLMGMNVKTPVLGIKVAGKNQFQSYILPYHDNDYFDTMTIKFTDTSTNNFDPQTMLFVMKPNFPAESGAAVYQDTNLNGFFDEGDTVLHLDSFSWSGWSGGPGAYEKTLTINFKEPSSNSQAKIPQVFNADYGVLGEPQDEHDITGVDFFVVLRARPEDAQDPNKINYGADFTAQVTGMSFQAGETGGAVGARPPANNFTSYETKEIKAVYELSDYTGTRIDPNSTFPIIGINVNGGGLSETLNRFNLYLKKDGTNFNPSVDLVSSSLTVGVTVLDRNGLAVGLDIPAPGGWSEVTYQGAQWWKTTVTFSPTVAIPDDDIGVDTAGPDYFINLTTNSGFGYNKKIIASIPDNEFIFGTNLPSANGTALTTNANLSLTTDPLFPHGSNQRVYPDINPTTPKNNPILGNPAVVFSQVNTSVAADSGPKEIIGIDLADNTSADTVVLKSVVVQIVDTTSGGFAPSDLKPMSTDSSASGIGLYDAAGPRELAFPPSPDFSNPAEDYRRYLLVLKDPLPIPQSLDGSPDLYVTLNTSSTISSTDAVILRIWGSEIKPCSSYGLGFRAKDTTGADTDVETRHGDYLAYTVSSPPTQNTLTLGQALDVVPFVSDYTQNWYLVITAGGDNAVGRIYKVIGVTNPALTPVVTVEGIDLTIIGTVSAVKFFKVESASYRNTNNSFGVISTGGGPPPPAGTVNLGGVSNAAAIVLTWVDGTYGDPAVGFKIERRNVTTLPYTAWTEIESALASGNPKLVTIGPYTYQYTDTTGLVMNNTYQYRVTVLDGGTVSNTITVFFSAFFRKPQNLEAAGGIMNVYLEWDWPDGNKVETGYWEDGFYIERKKESDLDSAYAVIGVAYAAHPNDVFGSYTDNAFTDSMLRETTHYNYRVRAFNATGVSDYSNTVTAEVISSLGGSGTGTGGCFIATAAFGTPMAKEVVALRRFRDRFLLTWGWGKAFVRFYYRYSPTAAEYIRPRPIYCFIVRGALRPLVWLVKAVM